MAKIISLSAVREKRALCVTGNIGAAVIDSENPKTVGESSTHTKPHHRTPVNLYRLIHELKSKIKLQKQAICILAQENKELKS